MRLKFLIVTILFIAETAWAQKTDTVIVSLAKTSKVVFTIQDRRDLEILRHYNFQDLFNDILKRIEESDTTATDTTAEETVAQEDWSTPDETPSVDEEDEAEDEEWNRKVERKRRGGRTWQSTNIDIGTNNFLSDGEFPDGAEAYTVRPWGSWYVGVTSTQRTRLTRNFFFEWGFGVSWYNFKFEDDNTLVVKNEQIAFTADPRGLDYVKSKLSATYLNVSLVPLLDFGDNGRKARFWDGYGSEFRIGVGPYAGYRIGSKSKLVYDDAEGDRQKEKNKDSFYLNNLRYGARLQVGFRSTDFFLNYDMNELFASGRGPKLNAISFGVIF